MDSIIASFGVQDYIALAVIAAAAVSAVVYLKKRRKKGGGCCGCCSGCAFAGECHDKKENDENGTDETKDQLSDRTGEDTESS